MFRWIALPLIVASTAALLPAQEKPAEKTTYKDHVLPIFRAKCGSCHNGNDRKGGLVLDDYGTMMQGGSSGNVVESGDSSASYLWELVTHASEPKMPPNAGKLPDEELAVIKKWIDGGLLENSGSTASVSQKPSLAKVEIKPGQRPAQVAMPQSYLGEPAVVAEKTNAVTALAVSPWAPLAAVSGHRQVAMYNSQTLMPLGVLPFPEGQPEIIRFSRTGDLLLVGGGRGGASGTVVVYDVKTGERKMTAGAEYDSVLSADISPDQTMIALGGPKRIVRVYSTATGEQAYEIKKHTDWVTAVAFGPDGVLLATGDRSNGLVVWESENGRIFYDLLGHKGAITDLSWRPDGNVLASASEDGTIKLWDMNKGTELKSWNAHAGGVASVEYTSDGRIVSVGRDKVARLWQGDGNKIRDFGGLADIGMEVAFDGESKRLLAGDWSGNIHVWNAEDGAEQGRINTNPPTLAMVVSEADKSLAAAQADAKAKGDRLATLQKQAADRNAAAETAVAAALASAEKVKQQQQAVQQAQQAVANVQTEAQKADEAAKQSQGNVAGRQDTLNKAAEALKQAEAALAQAKAAFEEAGKSKGSAEAAVAEATKAAQAATEAVNKTQGSLKEMQGALQQAQAAEKAAAEAAKAAQAQAEQAKAAAQVNEAQKKELDQAQQEAGSAGQKVQQLQERLEKLKALQKPAAPQTAAS